nr:hypothetical protein CFP56_66606 [Quercus suber]
MPCKHIYHSDYILLGFCRHELATDTETVETASVESTIAAAAVQNGSENDLEAYPRWVCSGEAYPRWRKSTLLRHLLTVCFLNDITEQDKFKET